MARKGVDRYACIARSVGLGKALSYLMVRHSLHIPLLLVVPFSASFEIDLNLMMLVLSDDLIASHGKDDFASLYKRREA